MTNESEDKVIEFKYTQKISVDFSYTVLFSDSIFSNSNKVFRSVLSNDGSEKKRKVFFILEKTIEKHYPKINADIKAYCKSNSDILTLTSEPYVIEGGETLKSRDTISCLCSLMAENNLCRQSYVAIIGGGAFLDTVGFAASIVHRGIRQIRIPTTVLSQNDSGVGVKTAVNMHGIKNFLGTFAPPYAVINDASFLKSLSYRDWVSGVPEAFKVAMIKDKDFFNWLCDNSISISQRNFEKMKYLIRRCAELHLNHIATSGDPFEFGSARPLDFGHWAAHKLEMLTDGNIRHGEAVSIGLLMDTYYAVQKGYTPQSSFDNIIASFKSLKLPIFDKHLLLQKDGKFEILKGIEEFREHLGGELHITMPKGIGNKIEINEMDEKIILESIKYLERL
jgi:3-dehydroquinate synthase